MLSSLARRRLAQKTSSALGLVSTFVLLAGSFLLGAAPAQAALLAEKNFTYTCTGGPFNNPSITVKLSAPTSVTAGQPFNLTVGIPALTLTTQAPETTNVSANLTMTVTGGTVTTTGAKQGAPVTQGQTAVVAGNVIYPIAVTATATGNVTIDPQNLTLALASAPTDLTTCTTTSTETLQVPIGTGGGGGDDGVVKYACTVGTETANVDIKFTATMPTNARANQEASFTWATQIQTTGDELKVPATGIPAGTKYFATVKASGAGVPASATGDATITGTAGQNVTLPSVSIKVKPTTTGTVTITPGDLMVGAAATGTGIIKCTAPTTGLPTFTFQVAAASASPSPSPSPTPTKTTTVIVTETPTTRTTSPTARSSKTPKDGVATGAGGMAGPDGRMFILAGSVLILAAGGGGLLMRRRAAKG